MKNAVERFTATGARQREKTSGLRSAEYRLRVGDYRVSFELEKEIMRALRVRNRREAYR